MSQNAIQQLRFRVEQNPLDDADDLMEYVQYAARLAALEDNTFLKRIPELFAGENFTGLIPEILEQRVRQGVWELEEYDGEMLAMSLMDANDFYCFQRLYPEVEQFINKSRPWFGNWWNAAQYAELNAEAAEMLEAFLETFPIPEDLCLAKVQFPITEGQYALLDAIYADVEIPVIEVNCPSAMEPLSKELEQEKATYTVMSPSLALAADDGSGPPGEDVKKRVKSENNRVQTPLGMVTVSRELDDAWNIWVTIELQDESSPPVRDTQIVGWPGIRDEDSPTDWCFCLKHFDMPTRLRLMEEPMLIRFTPGFNVKCLFRFA